MTLRLPFNWQKTRFSMYCSRGVVSGPALEAEADSESSTDLLQFWLSLRHLGRGVRSAELAGFERSQSLRRW